MAFSSVVVFLPDDSLQLFDQPGDLTAAALLREYPAHQLQLHVGARRVVVPADKVLEPGSTYHVVSASSAGAAGGAPAEGKSLRPRTPVDFPVRGAAGSGVSSSAGSDGCAIPPVRDGKDAVVAGDNAEGEGEDAVPPLRASRGGGSAGDDDGARAGMAATAAAMMLTGSAGGAGVTQRDGFLRLMAEIHDGGDGAAELDLGPPVVRSNRKSRSSQQPLGDSSRSGREGTQPLDATGDGAESSGEDDDDRADSDSPRRPRISEDFISVPNTCMTDPDMSGGEKKRTLAAELADMSTTMTNVMVQSRMLRGNVV
ncbi:hypothetical protein CLOM_g14964 [Closterium sp. NIES-68]|nr:hypothetical protein CLOM_g14964 [Closterium sp. NIES-68]GJP70107.1 hypothetical protein CLOP_g1092 [Closterium sp. NIES-67]